MDATIHTFPERSRKDLSKNVWVVALIVYSFRDKRQKHQHRRLNSSWRLYLIYVKCYGHMLAIFLSYRATLQQAKAFLSLSLVVANIEGYGYMLATCSQLSDFSEKSLDKESDFLENVRIFLNDRFF